MRNLYRIIENEIKEKGIETITLDIFDTVLLRKIWPEDMQFLKVSRKWIPELREVFSNNIQEYELYSLRMYTRKELLNINYTYDTDREKEYDVNLKIWFKSILEQLSMKYSIKLRREEIEKLVQKMIQLEIDTEKEELIPNAELIEAIQKIKKKYKELLKRYHRNNPENYDKIFSRINEAYGIALGFEQSNFNEYEGDSIEDIFDNFFNSANNSSYKSFFEKTQDFSNVFDENEIINKSISAWLGRLKNLLLSEKRPLTEYREILRDFHFNFDVSEKNQIREILQKNGLRDYAWRNITRIEMELLIYNLNNSNMNADILGETWVDTGKSENISLDEIVKNIVSENFSENEKGYEKFIKDYFNIKIFRLFGKNIALYPYRDIEQVGATFKFITYKIRNEYVDVNKYIEIFDREQKNKKIGISLRITSYLWSIFGAIVLFLFFLNPIVDWYIAIFGTIFFIILDWVNIAKEKEFEWSMRYGYSSYLSILMSIMFVVNLIVIGNAEYESSIIPFLLYSQLIFQFVFFYIILFVKMLVTTNIRYKRLRKFSKQILDTFILEK